MSFTLYNKSCRKMEKSEIKVIKFPSDTSHRKQWFTGIHFSHPAKMHLSLQLWLIDNFTKEGETILDPMSGSGTILVACSLGRHVIALDLEQKFVDMMKGNWEKIQQRGPQMGYKMGTAQILQGDARNLTGILADKIITSPPYAETGVGDWQTGRAEFQAWVLNELAKKGYVEWQGKRYTESEWRAMNHGRIDGRTTRGVHKHPTDGYGKEDGQIGNLPYGSLDVVATLPPYEATFNEMQHTLSGIAKRDPKMRREVGGYGKGIDVVATSPPYENQVHGTREERATWSNPLDRDASFIASLPVGYSQGDNIGNLRSASYLSAMLQVYQQCHEVLKPNGLLVLVTKDFIRNKQQVRLDLDTIRLCEQAGFTFQDRWYRELTSQSFWRIIYHQKYPDVELIKYEDILLFAK